MSSVEQVVRDILEEAISERIVYANCHEYSDGDVQRRSAGELVGSANALSAWLRDNHPPVEWLPLYLWRQPDGRFGFSGMKPEWLMTTADPDGPEWACPARTNTHPPKLDGMFHQNVCSHFVRTAFGDAAAALPSGDCLLIELAAQVREA